MGFAERKLELFRIVVDADEELTGKLIELARQLRSGEERFSNEELAEFERRSEEFSKNPKMGLRMDDSLARLRSNLKK